MNVSVRAISIPIALATAVMLSACAKYPPAAKPVTSASPPGIAAEEKMIVVARVNGTDLTNYALLDMMSRLTAIDQRSSTSEPRETIRKRALDILVLQELAIQDAVRKGLHVEDALIDRTMEQFIKKLGHEEGYTEYLAKNHISTVEFRAQVERSLMIQRILTEEVIKKALVTDDEIKKEYERTKPEYLAPEKISVVDVAVPRTRGEQAAMTRAQELLAAISADKDKDPSHLVSDATFSVHVAELDKSKEPALYEAARTLKTGELSGVIAGNNALHLLKVTEYSPARQKPYEEVKNTIEGKLRTAATIKRREAWEQELKKDAKIEILDPLVPQRQ